MSGKNSPPPRKPVQPPVRPSLCFRAGSRRLGLTLTRAQRRNRWLVGGATIGAHVAVFTALFWHYAMPPRPLPEPAAIEVSLIDTPKPTPPVPPDPLNLDTWRHRDRARSQAADHFPCRRSARILALVHDDMSRDVMSDSALAGAATIGEGGDTGGSVQHGAAGATGAAARQFGARRGRWRMRTALLATGHHGVAWNGDWWRHRRRGSARACPPCARPFSGKWALPRNPAATRPCTGSMVVLSLADGGTRCGRLAGTWRWSDLLGVRAVSR